MADQVPGNDKFTENELIWIERIKMKGLAEMLRTLKLSTRGSKKDGQKRLKEFLLKCTKMPNAQSTEGVTEEEHVENSTGTIPRTERSVAWIPYVPQRVMVNILRRLELEADGNRSQQEKRLAIFLRANRHIALRDIVTDEETQQIVDGSFTEEEDGAYGGLPKGMPSSSPNVGATMKIGELLEALSVNSRTVANGKSKQRMSLGKEKGILYNIDSDSTTDKCDGKKDNSGERSRDSLIEDLGIERNVVEERGGWRTGQGGGEREALDGGRFGRMGENERRTPRVQAGIEPVIQTGDRTVLDKTSRTVLERLCGDIKGPESDEPNVIFDFMLEVHRIIELRLATTRDVITYLYSKTKSRLRRIWTQAMQENYTWDELRAQVFRKLVPQRIMDDWHIAKVKRCFQLKDESVIMFVDRVKEHVSLLDVELSQASLMKLLLENMNRETKRHVALLGKPRDYEELVEISLQIEDHITAEGQAAQVVDMQGEHWDGRGEGKQGSYTNRHQQTGKEKQERQEQRVGSMDNRGWRESEYMPNQRKEVGTCWTCNGNNHYSNTCPNNRRSARDNRQTNRTFTSNNRTKGGESGRGRGGRGNLNQRQGNLSGAN